MNKLGFKKEHLEAFNFNETLEEQEMAARWAAINANWGKLEYQLYLVALPIKAEEAHEWALDFFSTQGLGEKSDRVKRELIVATDADPVLQHRLTLALDKVEEACGLRNPLIHGIWSRSSDRRIQVHPLRLAGAGSFSMADTVTVTNMHLVQITNMMRAACQHLSSLSSEVLAAGWLLKRSHRASSRPK